MLNVFKTSSMTPELLNGPVMLQCTAGRVDDRTNHIGLKLMSERAAQLQTMQCVQ